MEPFRILVDRLVKEEDFVTFESREKYKLWNLLNDTVHINGTRQTVLNAIKIYTRSVFEAINDADLSQIKFYSI